MTVNATTYLADAKVLYGEIQNQVSTQAAFMNLLEEGPMDSPVGGIGLRGFIFLARLAPNWNMGYRPEGTSGVGTAGNQGLAQSTVSLAYAYCPIVITGQAENLTKGGDRAFMAAKSLEATWDMKDLVSHVNVVMVGADRGGQLAQVASAASGSFVCDATANLPGAIYLRAQMPVDTNAITGGALSVSNNVIQSINYTTRTITLTDAETAIAGEGVYLAGEAALTAGTFPYTAEGLMSLVAASGSRQGLNPATGGQESWASFVQDVGGTDISSQVIHEQIAFCKNRSGEDPDIGIWPSAQINKLTAIATSTLRFDVPNGSAQEKKALDLGFRTYSYGGRTIVEDKDARTDRTFWGKGKMMRKFEPLKLALADDESGTWTRLIASASIADATGGLLRWYHQLGIMQRSAWSMYYNFTVPSAFQLQPPTL